MPNASRRDYPLLFSGAMVRAILAGRKCQTRRLLDPQPTATADRHWAVWEWRPAGLHIFEAGDPKSLINLINRANQAQPDRFGFARIGDRIWVREAWRTAVKDGIDGFLYRADGGFKPIENSRKAADRWCGYHHIKAKPKDLKANLPNGLTVWEPKKWGDVWRPSIHMPRDACRILLEVVSVRVESLWSLTTAEAQAEGVRRSPSAPNHRAFWTWDDDYPGAPYFDNPIEAFGDLWDQINPKNPWIENPTVKVTTFRRIQSQKETADA